MERRKVETEQNFTEQAGGGHLVFLQSYALPFSGNLPFICKSLYLLILLTSRKKFSSRLGNQITAPDFSWMPARANIWQMLCGNSSGTQLPISMAFTMLCLWIPAGTGPYSLKIKANSTDNSGTLIQRHCQ